MLWVLVSIALLLLRLYTENRFFGSGVMVGCGVVVLVVTSSSVSGGACFLFRSCYGSILFQQQPAGLAEAPVLTSAVGMGCSWLHNVSASSVILSY
jgi:hypothetical protein